MTHGHDIRAGGEIVESFERFGILAFTTGRAAGSFGTASDEPVREVMSRWSALRTLVGGATARLATATQVHGTQIIEHAGAWRGWLRGEDADGHLAFERGTAMAVTVADCVPVFLAHPSGATAMLHSGWRGTAGGVTARAIERFVALGLAAKEIRLHCGPAICGRCYEVSPDVFRQLTGRSVDSPTPVDLRGLIAAQARTLGIHEISLSALCTRCDGDRFYSHRGADSGRQLGVVLAHRA